MSEHAAAEYYLGGPVWSAKDWIGTLYRAGSTPKELLAQYASVFNTVEGNTTFYGTPAPATVARWIADTGPGFRFCLKLPRVVTHDIRLREHCWGHLHEFFDAVSPLGSRLGPFMIQLSASFPPDDLDILDAFLARLPRAFAYALEVRHAAFFSGGPAERALTAMLDQHGVDRVIFDTRGLRTDDTPSAEVRRARTRKPNPRWHGFDTVAAGRDPLPSARGSGHPVVRFCGHSELTPNDPWLDQWVTCLSRWMAQGRTPYFFVHTPGDRLVPELARRFHQRLAAAHPALPELRAFPGDTGQLTLF